MRLRDAVIVVALGGATLAGCAQTHATSGASSPPASIEVVPATGQRRLHLTAQSVRRLGIQTGTVRHAMVPPSGALGIPAATFTAVRSDTADTTPTYRPPGSPAVPPASVPTAPTTTPPSSLRQVMPYSAVLYQPDGEAFTYANAAPDVFVRLSVTIDYVTGDLAVLANGPPDGTLVVTVGGPELLGIDEGVGA
jgi:hypothetical protein